MVGKRGGATKGELIYIIICGPPIKKKRETSSSLLRLLVKNRNNLIPGRNFSHYFSAANADFYCVWNLQNSK